MATLQNNNRFNSIQSQIRQLIKPTREFRATRKGLMVDKPNLQATPFNANASLSIMGREEGDQSGKFYLFVDGIKTSWNVSGGYAQTPISRTWMPRNLTMQDLIIEGMCANQYEYDRLVVFIRNHMYEVLTSQDEIFEGEFAQLQIPALDFKLFPPGIGNLSSTSSFDNAGGQEQWALGTLNWSARNNTYSHIPNRNAARRVWMFIVVTNISAGHERFQFAPAFSLTCKVLWDSGDPDRYEDIKMSIKRELEYHQVFGPLGNPLAEGPEIDSKLPPSTYTGSSRSGTGGTGGRGGFEQWAPDKDIDSLEKEFPGIKAWLDANAPGFDPGTPENIAAAREIKAKFPTAYPPGDRQYFGKMAQEGNAVKFRNPPHKGNTIRWR